MANEKPQSDTSAVMDRMADVLEQLTKNAPIREPGLGSPEYQQRLRDEGFMTTLIRPAFQNGHDIEPRGLSAQTIERLDKLKPGKYLGGKVTVAFDNHDQVHLLYKSAQVEDRMRYQTWWVDFPDLVNKIWAEMHQAPAAMAS